MIIKYRKLKLFSVCGVRIKKMFSGWCTTQNKH